jgi:PDZ domain-containing protein
MSRRALTLVIAGAAVIIALVAAVLLPVPYVILGPGPTLNTLGKDATGKPLITVSGHRVYPASGHLNMVTVTYQGGPGNQFNVFTGLRAWLDKSEAVVPQTELFAPGQSQQQVQKTDQQQMTSSQQTATAAAFHQLGIGYKTVVGVAGTQKGMPSYRVLHPGDVITAVDGQPVTNVSQLTGRIKAHGAAPLHLTIVRGGATRQVQLTPTQAAGHPVIGVLVQTQYQFPFPVNISIGDIGGPSAGMMFALGLIDKLSPMNLTGGRFIAGTGEISATGTVGAIGGIQQKMVGARDAGATVFLTPAGNCADTAGAVPAGLRVVKVSTLSGAVSALQALKAGRAVPSC